MLAGFINPIFAVKDIVAALFKRHRGNGVQLPQQAIFPAIPELGTGCRDIGNGHQVEVIQSGLGFNNLTKPLDGFGI